MEFCFKKVRNCTFFSVTCLKNNFLKIEKLVLSWRSEFHTIRLWRGTWWLAKAGTHVLTRERQSFSPFSWCSVMRDEDAGPRIRPSLLGWWGDFEREHELGRLPIESSSWRSVFCGVGIVNAVPAPIFFLDTNDFARLSFRIYPICQFDREFWLLFHLFTSRT